MEGYENSYSWSRLVAVSSSSTFTIVHSFAEPMARLSRWRPSSRSFKARSRYPLPGLMIETAELGLGSSVLTGVDQWAPASSESTLNTRPGGSPEYLKRPMAEDSSKLVIAGCNECFPREIRTLSMTVRSLERVRVSENLPRNSW